MQEDFELSKHDLCLFLAQGGDKLEVAASRLSKNFQPFFLLLLLLALAVSQLVMIFVPADGVTAKRFP